ncbi:MAG: glutathione S-transferase family protein [Myxococcota bacterium]
MSTLEILGLPESNYVWATRFAIAEKGVPHTLVPTPPQDPAVKAIHPLGKVPVMRHGDVVLGESRAICAYVDATFEGPALMPACGPARWLAEQWVSMVRTSLEPFLVRKYLFATLFAGEAGPDRNAIEAMLPELDAKLDVLTEGLAAGAFGGNDFTLVDAYLGPILAYLGNAPESAEALSRRHPLAAYATRLAARPTFAATAPPSLAAA